MNKLTDGKYLLIHRKSRKEYTGWKYKNYWSIEGKQGLNDRSVDIQYEIIKEIK